MIPVSGTLCDVAMQPLTSPGADDALRAAVHIAWETSGYRALAFLDCEIVSGVVVLSGVVSSFYLKQVAQAVVQRLELADRIENRVEVRRAF